MTETGNAPVKEIAMEKKNHTVRLGWFAVGRRCVAPPAPAPSRGGRA
jgi:hypothetical protein